MNWQQPYMGSYFYVEWKRRTLTWNHPLSVMLRANSFMLYPLRRSWDLVSLTIHNYINLMLYIYIYVSFLPSKDVYLL